jgi:hypothetical protein
MLEKLKEVGVKGKINIPSKNVDVGLLDFDDYHINVQRNHNVKKEEAISFIKNSKISISIWNGLFEKYYSEDGVAYVDMLNNTIRTAYKFEEFTEQSKIIMEILNDLYLKNCN